ncbi:MAG: dockerin type I domain-containing protein, partial [Acidobacteriota bacterium]
GRPFQVGLLVLDENGRVVTDYQGHVLITSSDTGAALPSDVIFDPSHQGYQLVDGLISFSSGGLQSLTATDRNDATVTGTRSGLVVENPSVNLCIPGDPDPFSFTVRPWGIGKAFSDKAGVRYQYLIRASAIGRPALITDLNWGVNGGPDSVQWENLQVRLAHKPLYALKNQAGEVDLDRNLADSNDVALVHVGREEQKGMQDAGRFHLRLGNPFTYNGIDNLLLEIRYAGGGPAGLKTDEVLLGADMIFLERLGPNLPVPRSAASTVCLGARLPSGTPPKIGSVKVDEVNNTSATLSWRTSPATNGWVLLGESGSSQTLKTETERLSFSHTIFIDHLQAGVSYEAIAVSQDVDAQITRSAPVFFTTTNVRPSISTMDPSSLPVNTSHGPAQIRGLNFFAGIQVSIISAMGPPEVDPLIRVVATSLVSNSVLNLALSIDAQAVPGPRRIRVTNLDGIEAVSPFFFGVEPSVEAADMDASGRVDGFDLLRMARAFGQSFPGPLYDPSVDLNGDGDIDGLDLNRLAQVFGRNL